MPTDRIRTTISLTPEALAVFKRMADAGHTSVSRCMGDWLVDTCEAAELITTKMEEAKRAPERVVREMRAMVLGMGGEVESLMKQLDELPGGVAGEHRTARSGARTDRSAAGAPQGLGISTKYAAQIQPPVPAPPSSNTGGKSPKTTAPNRLKGSK